MNENQHELTNQMNQVLAESERLKNVQYAEYEQALNQIQYIDDNLVDRKIAIQLR